MLGKISFGATILGHLTVASILYFGIYGSDNDPNNWDMQQLVGVLTVFLYAGGYTSGFIRSFVERRTGLDLKGMFYMMAITLPTLSVIFSCIGIGLVLFIKGAVLRNKDTIYLIVLYILNIFFLGILSHSLRLWSYKEWQKTETESFSTTTREEVDVSSPAKAADERLPNFISMESKKVD